MSRLFNCSPPLIFDFILSSRKFSDATDWRISAPNESGEIFSSYTFMGASFAILLLGCSFFCTLHPALLRPSARIGVFQQRHKLKIKRIFHFKVMIPRKGASHMPHSTLTTM